MGKWICIGLDIGNTLTKVVVQNDSELSGIELQLDTERAGDVYEVADAEECICWLTDTLRNKDGGYSVGVTGYGAETFLQTARRYTELAVTVPDGDAVTRELTLQTHGVRALCRREGLPLGGPFLLVSVGTGTSYTIVDAAGNVRAFPIGGPLGGGTLSEHHDMLEMSGREGYFEMHGDILMKDRYPAMADSPLGDLVLSSGGRANKSDTLDWVTETKKVATAIAERLALMQLFMPDWKWEGPVVVIGTPVDTYPAFRYWLGKQLTLAQQLTGITYRFVQDSAYAGAYGAYLLANGELKA